jgi:hypothetical protein
MSERLAGDAQEAVRVFQMDPPAGSTTQGGRQASTHYPEKQMRPTRLVIGAVAAVLGVACSDSTSVQGAKASDWSGAVIKVAATDPNAKGELRGVVVDSSSGVDPSQATPIPGATVVLNLKVTMQPGNGSDTAWTTVTKIGEVVTDANGRFLVTAIPQGDYYLVASPPANEPFYSNSTWAFVSSGANDAEAVIYLPRELGTPPDSSGGSPTGHPIDPPIDSM